MDHTSMNKFNSSSKTPTTPHSPWHSPVPYLFGGLAAMLGLIAFALLILACSYWKLSGYLENGDDNNNQNTDLEAGEGKNNDGTNNKSTVFEEKILVIMAGQEKPTFLATPVSSRLSSFGDNSNCGTCTCEKNAKMGSEETEMVKQSNDGSENNERSSQIN